MDCFEIGRDYADYVARHGHERVVLCADHGTGLRAVIALHNTTLGPALGGTRIKAYDTPEEGLRDVLRLAEGMTYKAAVAGLPFGGGKGVILADGKEARDPKLRAARFRAYGRFVESLGGHYITAEDVGTSPQDMAEIARATRHVAGTPRDAGGCGDPSPTTAFGVMRGMEALAEEVLHRDPGNPLEGVRVAIQGLGHVGMSLAELLVREKGATVVAAEVREPVAQEARERLAAFAGRGAFRLVAPEAIYDQECDIFAPCGFGAVLNPVTIPRLRCAIVAGAANNQLEEEERDGTALLRQGIAYAVDYVINAGGLIHVAQDRAARGAWSQADEDTVLARAARIYDTIKRLTARVAAEGISPQQAARALALDAIGARSSAPPS